jgi:cytochrome c peroxidase
LTGVLAGLALLLAGCGGGGGSGSTDATDDGNGGGASLTLAELGERIFNDTNLSNPVGQSCASCHDQAAAFTDPDSVDQFTPVSVGADGVSVGSRNAPTAGYAAFIPPFSPAPPRGGQFLDGRALNLEAQARAPFLNPVEMNMADEAAVIAKLRSADYADAFLSLFGANAFDNVSVAYTQMVTAIAAFERTAVFTPFSSNFDRKLTGSYSFSAAETNGETLFNGKAQCHLCHNSTVGPQVFSDFLYSNIGVPANPAIVGAADKGLGGALGNAVHDGKFRTPTLRNVAVTAPYMHNGVFDTLEDVINFYNRRDLDGVVPEVAGTVDNRGDLGELALNPAEIQDLIAFLQTLTDI